jgi:hypothetical protein
MQMLRVSVTSHRYADVVLKICHHTVPFQTHKISKAFSPYPENILLCSMERCQLLIMLFVYLNKLIVKFFTGFITYVCKVQRTALKGIKS